MGFAQMSSRELTKGNILRGRIAATPSRATSGPIYKSDEIAVTEQVIWSDEEFER